MSRTTGASDTKHLKQSETPSSSVMNESCLLNMSNLTVDKGSERKLRSSNSSKQQEISLYSVVDECSLLDMSNVTVGRGSERKSRSRKKNKTSAYSVTDEMSLLDVSNITPSNINESSVLDMSNVTVGRRSESKPRKRKFSFLSPVMTSCTPRNSNIKMRPKTPIVARTPLTTIISPSPMKELKINLGERIDKLMHLTPLAEKISCETGIESKSFITSDDISIKEKENDIPNSTSNITGDEASNKEKQNVIGYIGKELGVHNGNLKGQSSNQISIKEEDQADEQQLYYLPSQTDFGAHVVAGPGSVSTTLPPHISIKPAPVHTKHPESTSVLYERDNWWKGFPDDFLRSGSAFTVGNEDEAFFYSLMPLLQKFNDEKKLELRINILASIKEINDKRSIGGSAYSVVKCET